MNLQTQLERSKQIKQMKQLTQLEEQHVTHQAAVAPLQILEACRIPLFRIAWLLATVVLRSLGPQINVSIAKLLFQEAPPPQSMEPVTLFQ